MTNLYTITCATVIGLLLPRPPFTFPLPLLPLLLLLLIILNDDRVDRQTLPLGDLLQPSDPLVESVDGADGLVEESLQFQDLHLEVHNLGRCKCRCPNDANATLTSVWVLNPNGTSSAGPSDRARTARR